MREINKSQVEAFETLLYGSRLLSINSHILYIPLARRTSHVAHDTQSHRTVEGVTRGPGF